MLRPPNRINGKIPASHFENLQPIKMCLPCLNLVDRRHECVRQDKQTMRCSYVITIRSREIENTFNRKSIALVQNKKANMKHAWTLPTVTRKKLIGSIKSRILSKRCSTPWRMRMLILKLQNRSSTHSITCLNQTKAKPIRNEIRR